MKGKEKAFVIYGIITSELAAYASKWRQNGIGLGPGKL